MLKKYEIDDNVTVLYKIVDASYSHEFGVKFQKDIEIVEVVCNTELGQFNVTPTQKQLEKLSARIYVEEFS